MKLSKEKAVNPKMDAEDLKWRTEEDVRTLERAEEIRKDSERMKRAMTMMEDKMDKIKSFVETMKNKKS